MRGACVKSVGQIYSLLFFFFFFFFFGFIPVYFVESKSYLGLGSKLLGNSFFFFPSCGEYITMTLKPFPIRNLKNLAVFLSGLPWFMPGTGDNLDSQN